MLSVITTLEFFQHHFSEMGHRDLLVAQTYLSLLATTGPLPHAQRPPPGGYVQTGLSVSGPNTRESCFSAQQNLRRRDIASRGMGKVNSLEQKYP
jgi:hypothetical protein